jgi:hypothetical protein
MTTDTQIQHNVTQVMIWLGVALVAVVALAYFFAA